MSHPIRDITVEITRLSESTRDVPLPSYATEGSAGMDVCAAVEGEVVLKAGTTSLIPTGFAIALPAGYEAQIRPRSGLAHQQGITVLNTPGTIDSDYRGEVKVLLVNLSADPVAIHGGDRIAQLVFSPVIKASWLEKKELDHTERGKGGFGSTGKR